MQLGEGMSLLAALEFCQSKRRQVGNHEGFVYIECTTTAVSVIANVQWDIHVSVSTYNHAKIDDDACDFAPIPPCGCSFRAVHEQCSPDKYFLEKLSEFEESLFGQTSVSLHDYNRGDLAGSLVIPDMVSRVPDGFESQMPVRG